MTKEQAIKLLRKETSVDEIHRLEVEEKLDFNEVTDKIQEAMDIGIEALETIIELEKRKFTIEDLQEYMKFEDELVNKNFTFRSVIEAREKQIAKKPYIWGDGYYNGELILDMYDCPNCEKSYEIEFDKYDYCPSCGQKIDWSEVDVEAKED